MLGWLVVIAMGTFPGQDQTTNCNFFQSIIQSRRYIVRSGLPTTLVQTILKLAIWQPQCVLSGTARPPPSWKRNTALRLVETDRRTYNPLRIVSFPGRGHCRNEIMVWISGIWLPVSDSAVKRRLLRRGLKRPAASVMADSGYKYGS